MLILMFKDVTHGDRGLYAPPFFPFFSIAQRAMANYYLALVVLVASGVIMYKIVSSTVGKIFISILDDETASLACGINVTKHKLIAFIISGCFASLAGSLWASIACNAGIYTLSLTFSFYPIIWTIFGGMQSIYGPIIGAVILEMLSRYVLTVILPIPQEWRMVFYVIPIMIFVLKFRYGVIRSIVEILNLGKAKRKNHV
jgi:branched-chain amino acid transport system permease protein